MTKDSTKAGNIGKKIRNIVLILALVLVLAVVLITVTGTIYFTYGGFGTGPCADVNEFGKYASDIDSITIPEGTRIVALGEATHGNKEFQELKLEVFKVLVEKYDVKAFALEGDFGGCERANRYIQGGEGTAEDAASEIGFAIYRTDEMADLLEWMREYNMSAEDDEKLVFYGVDMQQYSDNCSLLIEDAKELGIDTSNLEKIFDGEEFVEGTLPNDKRNAILEIMVQLEEFDSIIADYGIHHAEVLIQNFDLGQAYNAGGNEGTALRDKMMYENTLWVLETEEKRGNNCIMLAAHNGHIEQNGTYYDPNKKVTGHLLSDEFGEAYFSIGTDFFATTDNLPKTSGERVVKKFYSYDPFAKAAEKNNLEMCYIDFASVPASSPLRETVDGYCKMGSLGESYSILNRLLTYSYRVNRVPSETFDALIIVTKPQPTEIKPYNE